MTRPLFLAALAIPALGHATVISFDDSFAAPLLPVGSSYTSQGVTFLNAAFIPNAHAAGSSGDYAIFATVGGFFFPDPLAIYAEFDSEVSIVSIDAIDLGNNGFTLAAFDAGHNLIDSDSIAGTGLGLGQFGTATVAGAGIKYLKMYQNDIGLDGLMLDNLRFESATEAVPEPASMAVLGLGALALLRRRARK